MSDTRAYVDRLYLGTSARMKKILGIFCCNFFENLLYSDKYLASLTMKFGYTQSSM